MQWPTLPVRDSIAILVSGGLDSAVMLGESLPFYRKVYPIYIRVGSYWEETEFQYLKRFLESIKGDSLQPLKMFQIPVDDVYGEHWSLNGTGVPDENSPDEAVFLPGRNVLLLSKALIWCHLNKIPQIAMAPLEANPFPDATVEFFDSIQQTVNLAMDGKVEVIRPYQSRSKADVIRLGRSMALQHTFSCIKPVKGLHCGACNKCAERQSAFRAVAIADPTEYAV